MQYFKCSIVFCPSNISAISSFPCDDDDDDDGVDLKPPASERSFQYISLLRLRTGLFFFICLYTTLFCSCQYLPVFLVFLCLLLLFIVQLLMLCLAHFNVLSFLKKRSMLLQTRTLLRFQCYTV